MSIYKKWKPIVDIYYPNATNKVKNFFCEYAEHASQMMNNDATSHLTSINIIFFPDFICEDLVENDKVFLSQESVGLKTLIFHYDSSDRMPLPSIEEYTSVIKKEVFTILKKELKYATAIRIHSLIKGYTINNYQIIVYTDYQIIGNREDKIRRILEN